MKIFSNVFVFVWLPAKSIMESLKEEGLFTFLGIIRTAGLEESLRRLQHFTMFAPSETAMHCMYGFLINYSISFD